MRRFVFALLLPLITASAVKAQNYDPQVTAEQQQTLQSLLNSAIVALRQNDPASACNLRSQALSILNANLAAFEALFPANNWSDLQVSLQGSLRKCAADGFPTQGG
ncbi:MAG: hypothetical protein VKL97_06805 [Cyanobacteriota bacterium]|nr:hypothetical protein [Cyanobacteriota bacterium]